MNGRHVLRGLLLASLLAPAALAGGCSPKGGAKTYPVSGSVRYKGGGSLAGGAVSFQSVRDVAATAVGDIKEDGTFSLHTIDANGKVGGAPEGTYRVVVMPPLPPDHRPSVGPIPLRQTFEVQRTDNQLTIEVDPQRRRW